ncbi:unnamed protein product [Thlaspi arvense]|uniref:3'-5' exonuclease domain-containing protein n=1 Tax=Thlaspi arvense TaxID=13288 RepID=A0AAU9RNJ1_THLAR|nr:unnamed protein product [Thlaspi arvense]
MDLDPEEAVSGFLRDEEEACGPESEGTLSLHAFSDLTHVSPIVFLYLLKECYIHGSIKATKKFQALQHRVHQVLANKPQPGPATFIVQCLNVLPVFGTYGEGFSHLVISSLRRYFKTASEQTSEEDVSSARRLAARLFVAIVGGSVAYDEKAYNVIKKNYLQHDFPELSYKCKESALKDLAEKACWDVAEIKAKGERKLLEYLVYLAMEAGYYEKVDELCERYSLEGLPKAQEAEAGLVDKCFLQLNDLAVEDVVWVDEVNGLREATSFLKGCKVIGLDCEWKPNYTKGSKPNKVSIMQIGSDSKIFILDLIKLYNDASQTLDRCLGQILQSYKTLKLGYNFQCDIKQLALSYGDLECFKRYDMLLDIQNVFKETCGGLSGLTKKILGVGLNKTRRNSDWEQRPLTQNQLEYAALDAAVLVHILRHVPDDPPHDSSLERVQWKSHIVSHMENPKKSKNKPKKKPKCDATQTSASDI